MTGTSHDSAGSTPPDSTSPDSTSPNSTRPVAIPHEPSRWKRWVRRAWRWTWVSAVAAVGFTVAYLLFAVVLGLIPVNTEYAPADDGVEVFAVSNGIHVDFVLPVRTETIDWSERLPRSSFPDVGPEHRYIWFGWGERSFYIETPTWDDAQASVIAKAMLWPTETTMHVSYSAWKPAPTDTAKRLVLTREAYTTLAGEIQASFETTSGGGYRLIPGASYGATDNFYEANGTYHLFNTCNMWTNRLLKKSGVRTALWSPFAQTIVHHLE